MQRSRIARSVLSVTRSNSLSTNQPIIHFLIFLRGNIPGEIGRHATIHDLVPLALLIVVDLLRITDGGQHLMGIIVGERKAGSRPLVFVLGLHRILQAAGLADDGNGSVAKAHQLAQATVLD